ncbi:carboxypeptidase regulatory-like domain-containing protein [Aurantibacter sp.]|uniref:carboxypeptidase regulatory-like domain-containing protein n=1 Tax=Aurantibacter sp. TaxID=2807103 RepID=UPI0035C80F4D
MKKILTTFLFGIFSMSVALAQQTIVKGSVVDGVTGEPLENVIVKIEETKQETTTNGLGEFVFTPTPELGEQTLVLSKDGYVAKRYPIVVNEGKELNITDMSLDIDISDQQDLFTVTLSEEDLNDDDSGSDNISGLLSSSMDVFQRTAAFEFSSSFFRVRGLDSDNATVMINGIEMNKFDTGRPQWGNWGGLNDVVRNQELATNLHASAYTFGGVLGSTNISTRASAYREGGQITYSSSNRSYSNRLMAKYSSGLMEDGWAYTIMAGRRWGDEGFQDATLYDANSFFASIEKKINDKHSLNFTSIYAPNRRGKSSPLTQEVADLKGIKYNEYWGDLDGKKKNSRVKEVEEPILQLSHYWDINSKTSLNTTLGYQFGKVGNSRLDFPGGANPSPAYYQNLPSYHLSQIDDDGPNYAAAYLAEQEFINNGQINWNDLFQANINDNNDVNGNPSAAYLLYEDRTDDKTLSFNSVFSTEINENILLNAGLNYRKLKSENFAEVIDLLGSNVGVANVDAFSQVDFDLLNPGQIANEGDKFRYNFNLYAEEIGGFAQAQFKYNKFDFFLAGNITKTQYQREGLFKNGNQQFDIVDETTGLVTGTLDNSSGKGKKLDFTGFGAKAGFTYKVSGKHLFDVNGGYVAQAPNLRNTYTNSRESQDYVGVTRGENFEGVELTEEKIKSFDASYIFRSSIVKARLTGFYTKIEDANEVSFFFTQSASTAGFIQETLAGVDKRHIGAELGIEAQVTPTIKLKGAASVGQYTYDNNPFVYLTSTSEDFNDRADAGSAVNEIYQTSIKNYKVAGGPQRAYSVGFEYRDPKYWWFGATANFFSNTYVDISPLARSEYFTQDPIDGVTYSDYDADIARELLRQEKIEDYMVINLVGGKSWKVGDKYIGFFASIGNVLDQQYKTGGFEQGRKSTYTDLLEDNSTPSRVFAPKYFFGRGANYFLNCYVRF